MENLKFFYKKCDLPGRSWDSFVTGTLVYSDGLVSLMTTKYKIQNTLLQVTLHSTVPIK